MNGTFSHYTLPDQANESEKGPKHLTTTKALQEGSILKISDSQAMPAPRYSHPGIHSKDEPTVVRTYIHCKALGDTHENQRNAPCLSNCSLESPKNFQIFRKNNKSLVGVKGAGIAKSKLQEN